MISRKPWVCKYSACKKLPKGRICPHLEARLPCIPKGRGCGPKLAYFDPKTLESVEDSAYRAVADPAEVHRAFSDRLKTLGVGEHERRLLIARFEWGASFREIAVELGYTSERAARTHFRETIKKLKEKFNV